MNALVIGGAGYIGSHAVRELIKAGHNVVVMDNLSTGNRYAVNEKARFVQGDILKKSDMVAIFEDQARCGAPIDVVLHFAAKLVVPESVEKPLEYYKNNVEGVRTMLEAMVDCGIKNVVFSSTAATYGAPESGVCVEDGICEPINPYGETKLVCERMIKWASQAYGLNYCIFRYFNVAGADSSLEIGLDNPSLTWLVPILMEAALGKREKLVVFGSDYNTPDGTCIRDYIHVTDVAKAHVLGAQHLIETGESLVANLGSGSGYSVLEVIEAAKELFDFNWEFGPRRPGDPDKLVASIDKATSILGWKPELGLSDMLKSDYEFRSKLS